MCAEDTSRSFCREAVDKLAEKPVSISSPGNYRKPLPFNLSNPYLFTAKFFTIVTIGFSIPYVAVMYQMYKSGKPSSQ